MTVTEKPQISILLAAPRGFCAGVDRAIQIVEQAIRKWGAPVYVRHEIVHNRHVVERLERLGAVFVEDLDDCPVDRPVIFSAHGVPKAVPAEDATTTVRSGVGGFAAVSPVAVSMQLSLARLFSRSEDLHQFRALRQRATRRCARRRD